MTETDLAATTPATPLAALLESTATPPKLIGYRGALTPLELDAPAKETAALAFGAAVHDLGWLRLVAVRGEDRFRWLSGMVTNVVNELASNTGAWNLVLNAQGRIQGDLTVWRESGELLPRKRGPVAVDPGLELEIAADQYDKLLNHLNRFIIMDDVELVPLNGEATGETAVGLTGPMADDVLGRLGLPTLSQPLTATRVEWNGLDLRIARGHGVLATHYELWFQSSGIAKFLKYLRAAGAVPVGCASLEAFRIAEGIPAYGIDIAERDLPQETSQMRALNFNKGCYLGQEIVERIRSRGSVHRHLRTLELSGPVPAAGVELALEGGVAAGQITSAAKLILEAGSRVFALGMIRGEAEVHDQPFTYTSGTATGTARILAAPPTLDPEQQVGKSSS
ncbi:MAG: folate-binding protein [Terracidiphilus sp.]|jgi:folate-binding protein YgfZ